MHGDTSNARCAGQGSPMPLKRLTFHYIRLYSAQLSKNPAVIDLSLALRARSLLALNLVSERTLEL
jgi:hypothetical protein